MKNAAPFPYYVTGAPRSGFTQYVFEIVFLLSLICLLGVAAQALPNEVDYQIDAVLDTAANVVRAQQTVTITNRTGAALTHLYFHVPPNAFTRGADTAYQRDLAQLARADVDVVYDHPDDDASLTVQSIRANGVDLDYSIDDTLLTVDLNPPLPADETITLELAFVNDLIEASSSAAQAVAYAVRSGVRDGVYTLAKWYPQLVVFDQDGWHLDRYRFMGEFYGDFGDYVLNITVPQSFEVGASGALTDEIVNDDTTKTLTFEIEQARDVAWVASERFRVTELTWNEKRLRVLEYGLPDMPGLALDSVTYFGETFGPYAYGTLTVAQVAVGGGMEYPGIVMIGQGSVVEVSHEIAHQWWYAAVGNNEFEEGWLDEGPTTFSSELYRIEQRGEPRSLRSMTFFSEPQTPVLTRGIDFPSFNAFGVATYTKGSAIFWMLWELLGREVFLEAMRAYYQNFQFRNATTQNLIDTFESTSGQDLSAFFEAWLTTTNTFDAALGDVSQSVNEDGTHQTRFVLSQLGGIQMPVRVRLTNEDDTQSEFVWDGEQDTLIVEVDTLSPLVGIELDPDQNLLESGQTRGNNTWRSASVALGLLLVTGVVVLQRRRLTALVQP